jgi:ABC-type glycerol-3-phosphate transport system permease component
VAAVAVRATRLRPGPRPQLRRRAARCSAYVILTVAAVVCVFPVLWVVLTSLRTADSAFGRSFIPTQPLEIKMFHLLDSLPGLIVIYTATSVPFAVVMMRGFFQRSPGELADAARIDGASEWAVFLRVMVPLVRPAILTLAVFQFLFSWNEFLLAETFLSSSSKLTLQPRIYAIVGMYSTNWPLLCASLVIAMLPIVVLYALIQRRFVAGLTAGALRGRAPAAIGVEPGVSVLQLRSVLNLRNTIGTNRVHVCSGVARRRGLRVELKLAKSVGDCPLLPTHGLAAGRGICHPLHVLRPLGPGYRACRERTYPGGDRRSTVVPKGEGLVRAARTVR